MAKKVAPAFKERSAAVKAAHASLTRTAPGFTKLPGPDQIRLAQRHAQRRLNRRWS